jgi:hypothetical protein
VQSERLEMPQRVPAEQQVVLEQPDHQDRLVIRAVVAQVALVVSLVPLVPQALLDFKVQKDQLVFPEQLVLSAYLDLPDHLD